MAYEIQNCQMLGPGGSNSGPIFFIYNTTADTVAQVSAANYFLSDYLRLEVGSVIWVTASDGSLPLVVTTSTNASVVTAPYLGSAPLNPTGTFLAPGGLLYRALPGGATNNVDITVSQKITVIDFSVVLKEPGTAGDTVTLVNQSVGPNITNAVDVSGPVNSRVLLTTLNAGVSTLDAGQVLRITQTDGGGNDSPACDVFIFGYAAA